MIIYSADGSVLMEVEQFSSEGDTLRFRGKIMGAMPITAVVTPRQARKLLGALGFRLILFAATLLFRREPPQYAARK